MKLSLSRCILVTRGSGITGFHCTYRRERNNSISMTSAASDGLKRVSHSFHATRDIGYSILFVIGK